MMVQQQHKQQLLHKPSCTITIVHTAPPLFVETTQAEFPAVVQRLTGSGSGSSSRANVLSSSKSDRCSFHLSQSHSNVSCIDKPPIAVAPSNRRRPLASAALPDGLPSSGSSESLCDTSDGAAARNSAAHRRDDGGQRDNYKRTAQTPASCYNKKKARMCHIYDDQLYGALKHITLAEQQLGICNATYCVQESPSNTVSTPPPASSSPSSSSSSFSSAASSSSLHAPHPPLIAPRTPNPSHHPLSPASRSSAFPTTDLLPAVSHSTAPQLTTGTHDNGDDAYDDHDGFPAGFYCDPANLPPLVNVMIADEQQQLELFATLFYSSSTTATVTTPSPLVDHYTDHQWDTLNSSFTWKDDDFLCV